MQEFVTTWAIHEPWTDVVPDPEVPDRDFVWRLINTAVACDGSINKNLLYWTWEKLK